MNSSGDIARSKTGGTILRRKSIGNRLAEMRHPLTAIVANADAARHWLSRKDPNFHEAIAALDRIVKDSSRIEQAIATPRLGSGDDAGPAYSVQSPARTARDQFGAAEPSGFLGRLPRTE